MTNIRVIPEPERIPNTVCWICGESGTHGYVDMAAAAAGFGGVLCGKCLTPTLVAEQTIEIANQRPNE